jgi:hypothetical protein
MSLPVVRQVSESTHAAATRSDVSSTQVIVRPRER